jgi:hypothetical protein
MVTTPGTQLASLIHTQAAKSGGSPKVMNMPASQACWFQQAWSSWGFGKLCTPFVIGPSPARAVCSWPIRSRPHGSYTCAEAQHV